MPPAAPKPRRRLDAIDRGILSLLQQNARLTNKQIAETVNLSPTPCLRRIGQLEEAGFINGYRAVLEPRSLGFTILAFLSLKRSRESSREELSRRVMEIPEVLACHVVSGEYDLFVELVARDMDDYARITLDQISRLPGIHDLRSTFSIKALKTNGALPLAEPPRHPSS